MLLRFRVGDAFRSAIGFLLLFCLLASCAHAGCIDWQRCLGGIQDEHPGGVLQTDDGYIVAGNTYSNDGDVSGRHGFSEDDAWIVKLAGINCAITAPDMVSSGSTGNAASTAEQEGDYSWTIKNGTITSPSDQQSITFTAGASGPIRLTVRVTKRDVKRECSRDVAVETIPDCSWTSNAPVCRGEEVQFNGPEGMSSYHWDFGDADWNEENSSEERNPRHLYRDSGTYTVSLNVTCCGRSKNCTGTVDVRNLDCSWTCSSPIFSGTAVQFIGPSGMDATYWDFGDGAVSSDKDPTHVYSAPGDYIVSLKTVKGRCVDTCLRYIVVKLNPDCNWTSNSPVNSGTPVQFTGPAGKDTYKWEFGDGKSSSAQNPAHLYAGPGIYAVKLTVTNETEKRTCPATVEVRPDCSWTYNAPALSDVPVQFTGPEGMELYVWLFGDGTSSNSKDPVHTYRAPGNYNVGLTVRCRDSSKKCAKDVQILHQLDCNWTSNAPVCSGTPVQFTGPAGTYSHILWEFGDGKSSSAQNPAHLFPGPGIYAVNLTVAKGDKKRTCAGTVAVLSRPDCSWTFNAPVCKCREVQFTGPEGMDSYEWDFGDGNSNATQSPSHRYAAAGTYKVNLNVTKGGCSNSSSGLVVIKSVVNCRWTSNSPVCNGAPVQFTADPGMDSYAWDFGDGAVSSSKDPSHLYSTPGTYKVNLSIRCCSGPISCLGTVEVRQTPRAYGCYLDWQKCLGGSGSDVAQSIQQTANGGYVVAGYTKSDDGDVSGYHGGRDFWIVNLDPSGKLVWQKCRGASGWEVPYSVQQAKDGGYIAVGYTTSYREGDLEERFYGDEDFWIVKLKWDGSGDWQEFMGGEQDLETDDRAYSVQQTKDGGYVIAGWAYSNKDDASDNHGLSDYWVVKLGPNGKIENRQCYGGSHTDFGQSIQQTADGGYVVAGWTYSSDGDVGINHGKGDIWVVKLKRNWEIDWKKSLGGGSFDAAYCIRQTADKGYIVAGTTESNNGNVKGNHGGKDCWVVKLDESGNMKWQKCLGGSKDDIAYSVQQTKDGGYIVGGHTASNDGDVKGLHGDADFWVVKLDPSGNLIWQKCLGGSRDDIAYSIQQTADEGYVIAGYTYSHDGNVSGHRKDRDYWIVKLGVINCTITAPDKVCPGSAGNVASAGESGAAYAWSITNGTITSPSDEQSITFTAGSSGTVRLTVRVTVASRSQKCYYDEGYKDIKIRPLDCNWTSNAPICWGAEVRFKGPAGMDTYRWNFGDGEVSGERDPKHLYRSLGIYTVNLTVTSCGSSKTCTGRVEVRPILDCNWTSNAPVCDGTPVKFTGPAGMSSYRWDFGDGQASSGEDPSHLYRAPGTYTVNLTATQGRCTTSCAKKVEVRTSAACGRCIEWERCLGGSKDEDAQSVQQTADGGYIAAGYTQSNDGNVSGNHGGKDFWVVKFGQSGKLDWQKCLGGSGDDEASSVRQTADGGYVVAGQTSSNDGDVSRNHGGEDYWIVKLDASGNKTWQKCLGGSGDDEASSVRQTADGGYVVAGWTNSRNGDVRGNHGEKDYWVVKLYSNRSIEWQKCLGGSKDDYAKDIQQTADGGYVVAGFTASNDGDVSGKHDGFDFWIVMLDNSGNLVWQKCLGGRLGDQAWSIRQTADGGYVVAGNAASPDGDVGGIHCNLNYSDYWVVKLDPSGNKTWQKCLGGSYDDEARSVQQTTDGGYVVAGYAYSNDGNVSGNHGRQDFWIVKLDPSGKLVRQECLGGSGWDGAGSIQQTADGGYIVAGYTKSNDGDVNGNHGGLDFWVVKLTAKPDCSWRSNAPVCNGTPVQFTGPSGVDSYSWDFGDGQISSAEDPAHLYSAPGSYTVSLNVSGCGGLKSCSGSVEVRAPDCSWRSNAPVCNGTPVQFNGPAGMDAYLWKFGDGQASSVRNPSHLYSAPGSYTVSLNVSGCGGSKSCSGSVEVKGPDCSWTSNAPVCNGTAVQFAGPAGMNAWEWEFGDGQNSSARNPSHLYSAPATYIVSLKATKGGCTNTCKGKVEVMGRGNWTSNAPVCNGTAVQFTGPSGMDSYQWDFGDGAVGSGKGPKHLYSAPSTYMVKLNATKGSCTKSCAGKVEVRTAEACRRAICIEWQRCLGGIQDEYAQSLQQTADGGYIVAGYTQSNDGNVSGNHGGKDYWVVKLDPSGNKTWQKCLGGSGDDEASSVRQTADGGYMVAGQTNSSDGIVSGNHGGKDYWVVKLNESGHLVWQRCLGGSQDDYAKDVRQTADGGYVVAGFANSNNGDVSGNHGGEDFWIVKLDQSGNLTWQKCLGGKFGEPGKPGEQAWSIQQTSDGGYVVAGNAASPDGDVGGTHGKLNYSDYWVVKLDPSGNWVWKKCLGGRYIDEARSIQQTADGGYVVAGYSYSDDGNATGNHGNTKDYWVVKLDSLGSLSWQRSLGGFNNEEAYSVNQTADGGYIVAGYTNSNDGDVIGKHKAKDLWVVRLDPSGRLLWQDCLGGSSDEEARSVQRTADGGHVVAGATASNDGDVSGNHGGLDFWVVKLREINCTITAPDSVCAGSTGNLASTAESGAAYAWSITNGEITSANDTQSITFTAGSSGTLKLKVTVTAKGCMKECSKDITVTAEPDCSWTSNAPVCNGTPVQFTGPAGMAAYQWDFGDGAVSSARDPSHLYSAPGTHTVNLKVTAADGCSKNCTKDITVTAEPDCTISAPSSICAGSTGNSASTATSGAAYAWSITNGNITSASNTQSITFTAGAPGAVGLKVKVTNADGCAKECSKDITVTAMPDCTISAPDSVCAGSTGNAASTATPGAAYTWSITNGNITSASNTQSITFTAGAAGTTRLEVKVTTADGCSKSCIKDISITQGPDCTISAPDSVCAGSTGNTASTATSGAAYAWSITNGQITSAPTDQSITFTAGASGAVGLKVKVTNADGCAKERSKDITVTAMPDCTISAPDSVCAGSTGNAASTATSGAAYAWSITNGQITSASNVQSISFTAGSSGTTTLKVKVTAGGCSKECTKDITITSGPDCTISATAAVCAGSTGNAASTAAAGAAYSWSITNGQITSVSNTQSIVFAAGATGTTRLEVTVTAGSCSKKCSKNIAIISAPDCSWTSSSPVCDGTPVQFTGPSGMDSYYWELGDGAVSSAKDPSHQYSAPGTYTITLKATKSGCSKSCTGSVEVKPMPDCSWTSNSPVNNGTPVQFTGPAGMGAYQWDFGDGSGSTDQSPSHEYSKAGSYNVSLTMCKEGCSKTCIGSVVVKSQCGDCWCSNSPVCNGTPVEFDGPSGIDSYVWDFGDGQVSTSEDPSHLYSAPGKYLIVLVVEKDNHFRSCPDDVAVKPLANCSTTLNVPAPSGTAAQLAAPSGIGSNPGGIGRGQVSSRENRVRIYPG